MMSEKEIIEVLRNCPGGLDKPLTQEQKERIRDGVPNHPESNTPYNQKRLIDGANSFFEKHPID